MLNFRTERACRFTFSAPAISANRVRTRTEHRERRTCSTFLWILSTQFCPSSNKFYVFVALFFSQIQTNKAMARPRSRRPAQRRPAQLPPTLISHGPSPLLSSGDHPLLSPALVPHRTTSLMTCNILANGRTANAGLARPLVSC